MKKLYILFLFLCLSKLTAQAEYAVSNISPDLLKNASAVVRESVQENIFKSVNDLQIKHQHVFTLLNAAGDNFSTITIPYDPATKVSNIKVEVLDANGKSVKNFSRKDFSDYTHNPHAGLYVDDRILVLKITPSRYPYTIKYSYEINTSNTAFLSYFRPVHTYGVAVEKSKFTVNNLSDITIRKKITDKPYAKVSAEEKGNLWVYSYQNVPALQEETLAPSLDYLLPKVEFSPERFTLAGKQGNISDWQSFGKWYYEQLLLPVSAITPEIAAEVAALNLSGSTSDKVKTLFQYMQNKTRYVLISMGIGGWQPMSAAEVSKKGYGDCKALTNYMRTLLNAAGIPSYYAIINDNSSVLTFDKDFPRLAGNHVILMVPTENGSVWLENTSQRVAYNHLFYSSHNRNVMALDEKGCSLIDTPVYKPEQSKEKLLAKIYLTEDGGISGEANFAFSGGQYDYNLRLLGLNAAELEEAMKSRYSNLKTADLKITDLKNNQDEAKITYRLNLKANTFSKKMGSDLFFSVMPFYAAVQLSENGERKLPFETAFPFQDDYEIQYHLPPGYAFTEIPSESLVQTEFGNYTLKFILKENILHVQRVLTLKKGMYPKEKFAEYVAFRKKTASLDNTKILISKL